MIAPQGYRFYQTYWEVRDITSCQAPPANVETDNPCFHPPLALRFERVMNNGLSDPSIVLQFMKPEDSWVKLFTGINAWLSDNVPVDLNDPENK